MSQGSTDHEDGPGLTGINMSDKSHWGIMNEARRIAQNLDIKHGMINQDDRQDVHREHVDHQGSFTRSRRSISGHKLDFFSPQSHAHQTNVTSNTLRRQTARQLLGGAGSDEILMVTGAGQPVARIRLLVPADEFHRLLVPNVANRNTPPLRILSAVTRPNTVFNPAPGIPIVALQSPVLESTELTSDTTPRATSTPSLCREQHANKPKGRKQRPEKEKDWSKAVEKPLGATKLATEFCLTCIQNNRNCEGTDLVLVRNELRCKKCSEKDATTGTRRCFWKDPAKNVFTYKDAKAAAGLEPLWANTREGRAQRKTQKTSPAREAQATHSAEAEEDDRDNQEETRGEDSDEIAFNSVVDAAWQELYGCFTIRHGVGGNADVDEVTALETMRIMLQIDRGRYSSDVVGAIQARIDERTQQLEAMTLHGAMDLETPSTEDRPDHTSTPGLAVDVLQQRTGSTNGSVGQDSQRASETGYDAEDDLTSDESPMGGIDEGIEVTRE